MKLNSEDKINIFFFFFPVIVFFYISFHFFSSNISSFEAYKFSNKSCRFFICFFLPSFNRPPDNFIHNSFLQESQRTAGGR